MKGYHGNKSYVSGYHGSNNFVNGYHGNESYAIAVGYNGNKAI